MATKNNTALDLFQLLPVQRILARRACKAGIVPPYLMTYIRAHYRRLYSETEKKRSTID